MFYPSYEDYMRDIFYFNGLQQQNMNYSYPYMGFNSQNLNNYYPSIYRIVMPVIQKVINGNNYQFTNEEAVNNIVEVVLETISGDINNLEIVGDPNKKQTQPQTVSQSQQNKENNLLKDLIKILTIKELQSKQNVRRFPYSYGPLYMQNMPYMAN